MKRRPRCVWCGKNHGLRAKRCEVVIWDGGPMPPYSGNMVVTRTYYVSKKPQWADGSVMGVPFKKGQYIAHRDLWDGESFVTPYDPFCSLRCALAYARRTYERLTGRKGYWTR